MKIQHTGILTGSAIHFCNPPQELKIFFYYMCSCGHFICDRNYKVSHTTRPPLFLYIQSGLMDLEYEGLNYQAAAGDVILINCQQQYTYKSNGNCEFLYFHFGGKDSLQITDHLIRLNTSPIFRFESSEEVRHCITSSILYLCRDLPEDTVMLSSMIYKSLCLLLSRTRNITAITGVNGRLEPAVTDYIGMHLSEKITLQDLASCVNLSEYHFARLFKKETGFSPIAYTQDVKIKYAEIMLRTSSMSVADIAYNLGFASSASLINAFRTRKGISPARFRKLNEFHT